MKIKQALFPITLVIVIFTSCNKETPEASDSKSLTYKGAVLGGCNLSDTKSSYNYNSESQDDIITFKEEDGNLKIFIGLNLACCRKFDTHSYFEDNTLIMEIKSMNEDFCRCMCYYTYEFIYSNFNNQEFNYKFYIDDEVKFEGNYKP